VSLWLGQTIQIGRSRYRLTRLYSVATTEPDGVPGFQIMYEPANEAARRQPTLPARRIAVYDPSGASFRCAVARVMLNRKQELAYGYLNCAGEFQDVSSLTLELQSDEGDVVRIPLASPSTEAIVHEVAPGDTVVGIARQYNLTLDELIALNGWPESGPTKLIVGQAVVVEMGRPPQLVRVLPAPGTVQPGGKVRVCGTWDVAAGNLKGAARLSLDGRPLGGPGYVTEMRPTQEGPSLRREACWEVDLPVGPHTTTLRYTLANGDDFAYRWNFSVESNE
jgi:LysM repeat protein